jgi:putative ABC transport system permease protein
VAESTVNVTAAGISGPIPFIGYDGASDRTGYALISGRWFRHPGEVVVPTRVLTQARLQVGDTLRIADGGRTTTVRIVGEILDQSYDNLLLRGSLATLRRIDPAATPDTYEIALKPGINPEVYVRAFMVPGLSGDTVDRGQSDTIFMLFNAVIAGLALVLAGIAVAGVLNTVVLSTRERARDISILKAVGMAPAQVIAMVVSSVALLGLAAGILGVPFGLLLNRSVISLMGHIASGTNIPPAFFDLIAHTALPLLVLCGVLIAALGAWLPARWAATERVTEVLQAE